MASADRPGGVPAWSVGNFREERKIFLHESSKKQFRSNEARLTVF
jgi:hypothetical protein